ncbi:MAG TPA: Gfo/Idh/MocA family oxidoreductase [Blastocatellia bacterium]|nr:Gfo/Idh/MocA family oxidoreductase [Blastocatellia bacterium]
MKRRDFLHTAVISTTALSARRVAGANDRVRVGLIGCGGRGRSVARLMREVPGVEFVAACDVYEPNAAAGKEWAGAGARAYGDFRRLLEVKDVDAVLIATPDHWHAIPTVMACEAGKDVYVEKPLAHNVREGRAMLEAARRHRRVVQTGMQQRSAPHYREVQRIIRSGELGEVRFVRVWNFSNLFPHGIGRTPDSEPPAGLDWDLYLGPAPKVPFNRSRFLRTYRWFWDYAGGTMTDFGTHRLDTMQQVMGVEAPQAVTAAGARFSLKDAGEMPDVLQVTYEYPGFIVSYETCNLNAHGAGGRTPGMAYYQMRAAEDRPHGEAYYGTNGTLIADRIGFEIYPEPQAVARRDGSQDTNAPVAGYRMGPKRVAAKDATDLHVKDFIDCVRSRARPAADVEIGHRSATTAHLGNVAYRTRQKLTWDSAKEDFVGAPAATKLLGREARKPWDLI